MPEALLGILTATIALLTLWLFALYQYSLRKRTQLENYALLLLLEPTIATNHRPKLIQFIRAAAVSNDQQLLTSTIDAVQVMADDLFDKTLLATVALVGRVRRNEVE